MSIKVTALLIKLHKQLKPLFVSLDCSSDNILPSGLVTSPRYPSWYPPDMDCRQYIEVPENFSVKLEIWFFILEPSYDFLYVRT